MTRLKSAQTQRNAGRKPNRGRILTILNAPHYTHPDLATNLAVLLARHNPHTLLLHATPPTVFTDLISKQHSIDSLVAAGPEGLRVLAGSQRCNGQPEPTADDCTRALQHLRQNGEEVLINCGTTVSQLTVTLARTSDLLVITTTSNPDAMIDSYAKLKLFSSHGFTGRVGIIVGDVHDNGQAFNVTHRLARVARDFLGLSLEPLGHILADRHAHNAARDRRPVIVAYPDCSTSACLRSVCDRLTMTPRCDARDDNVWSRVAGLFL